MSLSCCSGFLYCSFIWSIFLFCLILSKFLFGRLVIFLDLGEVALCRGCPMCPSSTLPSHQSPKHQGPAGPRVGSDQCVQTQFHRLWGFSFLASGVCLLVGEGGLEACAGFPVGGASTCPLVSGAVSWPSGGQGHVQGRV